MLLETERHINKHKIFKNTKNVAHRRLQSVRVERDNFGTENFKARRIQNKIIDGSTKANSSM